MAEQKRFKKVSLNSDDYKGIENAAKYTRETGKYLGMFALTVGGNFIQNKMGGIGNSTPKINK